MKYESFEPNGSFFMLNENTMLGQGDCLELMKHIPDGSVDMVLTDPPYGTTACKWDSVIPFEPMWKELKRIIKPSGAIVLFGSEPFSSALRVSNIKAYKYDFIWVKSSPTGHLNAKLMPLKSHENILVFYSKQPTYNPQKTTVCKLKSDRTQRPTNKRDSTYNSWDFDPYIKKDDGTRYPKSVISFDNRGKELSANQHKKIRMHPTQKPVALLEYLIKTYTQECETVLDFTMGSGSTGVAAKNLNRKFIGIEVDDNYFSIAKNRIQEA